MKGELGGEKITVLVSVCARLVQSEVHVWSGITTAHDDICAIWK